MNLKTYLVSLLGEKQAKALLTAAKEGQTIIVSGEQCTGKTTLCKVLREHGYFAAEDFETHTVTLSKPLSRRIRNMKDTIS